MSLVFGRLNRRSILTLFGLCVLALPLAVMAADPTGLESQGTTSVYGITGKGRKFVYVFDRSGSMSEGADAPLNRAKEELIASLKQLTPTNQFDIIFYNHQPTQFVLGGQPGRLLFASNQNKKAAESFVRSIRASGGTEHQSALEAALKLSPDVVFFLTDADKPGLSDEQFAHVMSLNGNDAVIHTIELGIGPAHGRKNFLTELARRTGGNYVYVDTTKKVER